MNIKTIGVISILCIVFVFSSSALLASEDKNPGPSFFDKLEFEFSTGYSSLSPGDLYLRADSLAPTISQYAAQYNLSHSGSGEIEEISTLVPFNFSVNYRISKNFFLKAGIDFGSSSGVGTKTFKVDWPNFSENHTYDISDKISLVMPHIGGGYRKGNFDIYGAVGLGTVKVKHTEDIAYSEPGYSFNLEKNYDVDGSGLGIILGAKYRVRIGKISAARSFHLFIKLEALLLNIDTFEGTRNESGHNSDNDTHSLKQNGTVYTYDFSPYDNGTISTWELMLRDSTNSSNGSLEKLSMSMSTIRLMVGLSF